MDDNRFDGFIKDKVEGFKDNGVDKAAFADMQNRIALLPTGPAWYQRYKIIGSLAAVLALFTFLNYLISQHFSEKQFAELSQKMATLKEESSRYAQLENELRALKLSKTDTVYIYKTNSLTKTVYGNTLGQLDGNGQTASVGLAGKAGYNDNFKYPENAAVTRNNEFLAISNMDGLTNEIKMFLNKHFLLVEDNSGGLYLNTEQGVIPGYLALHKNNNNSMYLPEHPNSLRRATYGRHNEVRKKPVKPESISSKTLVALARHHYRGVDWQFGFESALLKSNWELGVGGYNVGFGLLGEAILSPSIRIEFGVKINELEYGIDEIQYDGIPEQTLKGYPDINSDLGALSSIGVESQILHFPINLKYYYPLTRNQTIYMGIGYSPQIFLRQEFDYKYVLKAGTEPKENYEAFIGTNTDMDHEWYVGSINASLGTELRLSDKLRWQIGAFYERSLGEMGYEGNKYSSFGLKSSIWFNKP